MIAPAQRLLQAPFSMMKQFFITVRFVLSIQPQLTQTKAEFDGSRDPLFRTIFSIIKDYSNQEARK